MKNIMLFMPLLAAHRYYDFVAWSTLCLSFVCFSLCASAVYIINDIFDVEHDRQHPRKKNRPIAAGQISVRGAIFLASALLCASIALAMEVSSGFLVCIVVYFLVTFLYSIALKKILLIDCLVLGILYTLRVISGAVAIDQNLSFWLLAFSVFLFLSLAFVKRYAELEVLIHQSKKRSHGRGYLTSDAPLIQSLGIGAGYSAALVLAFYLNSDAVQKLYTTPEAIWLSVPVVLFWISWIWLQAHRGNMHDDPLVYAVRDPVSLLSGIVFAATLILGQLRIPWVS